MWDQFIFPCSTVQLSLFVWFVYLPGTDDDHNNSNSNSNNNNNDDSNNSNTSNNNNIISNSSKNNIVRQHNNITSPSFWYMCYSNMVVCICFCNASVFHDDINIHAHCFRYHRLPRQKKQPPPRSEQFRFLFKGSNTDFFYAFINPFVYHFFGIFQLIWTPFCSLLPPVIFPWPFPRWRLIHRLRRCWTMARCCLAFHSCLAVGKVSNGDRGADVAGLARNLHEMGKKWNEHLKMLKRKSNLFGNWGVSCGISRVHMWRSKWITMNWSAGIVYCPSCALYAGFIHPAFLCIDSSSKLALT